MPAGVTVTSLPRPQGDRCQSFLLLVTYKFWACCQQSLWLTEISLRPLEKDMMVWSISRTISLYLQCILASVAGNDHIKSYYNLRKDGHRQKTTPWKKVLEPLTFILGPKEFVTYLLWPVLSCELPPLPGTTSGKTSISREVLPWEWPFPGMFPVKVELFPVKVELFPVKVELFPVKVVPSEGRSFPVKVDWFLVSSVPWNCSNPFLLNGYPSSHLCLNVVWFSLESVMSLQVFVSMVLTSVCDMI